ncbi:hypothetical protein BRCON_1419 [Candidatus Sumerlaea chitinivorans]|uniref:Uncharacterized protein n=1 Tax=Sumerlaea chitinivorans TaxID=2250252 RepID=A0A2Z4Y5H4_SUMC1|nr:hypothetical protein BRCON_1419 [Candidatus Sumerlaea chitinivorans]
MRLILDLPVLEVKFGTHRGNQPRVHPLPLPDYLGELRGQSSLLLILPLGVCGHRQHEKVSEADIPWPATKERGMGVEAPIPRHFFTHFISRGSVLPPANSCPSQEGANFNA